MLEDLNDSIDVAGRALQLQGRAEEGERFPVGVDAERLSTRRREHLARPVWVGLTGSAAVVAGEPLQVALLVVLQFSGKRGVHAAPAGFAQLGVNDFSDEWVTQPVADLSFGHNFVGEAGVAQPPDAFCEVVVVEGRKRGEAVVDHRFTSYGQDVGKAPVRVCEAVQRAEDGVTDNRRDVRLGAVGERPTAGALAELAGFAQAIEQRLGEQGDAAGTGVERVEERVTDRSTQLVLGNLGQLLTGQRLECDLLECLLPAEGSEDLAQRPEGIGVGAVGEKGEHPLPAESPAQVGEQRDGRGVGLVRIVNEHQNRRGVLDALDQPGNRLEQPGLLECRVGQRLRPAAHKRPEQHT
jgi:hypothetical protein